MRRDSSADHLQRLCALLSVIALGMVVITMQREIPDTITNSVIDGVRFVLGVAVMIGGVVVMIERRVQEVETKAAEPIDLREIDLRDPITASAPLTSPVD